ncbi:MAG: ATP-binding protein [Alistipes sp.]|nr:ATP-binding protein [Candidatus Alistipes equi]
MKKRFDPVAGCNADIITCITSSEEVRSANDDIQFKVRLCVEEVEENILAYSGTTWLEVWTAIEEGYLAIGFRDGGVKFDPTIAKDPDIMAPVDKRAIGGLGIFICKQMMNVLDYRYEDGCNVFVMKIKLP